MSYNLWNDLYGMEGLGLTESNNLSLNKYLDSFTDRLIPHQPDLYMLLTPYPEKGAKSVRHIILRAIQEYDKHFPLVLSRYVDMPHEFVDNFHAYVEGRISLKNVELIPKCIVHVQYNELSRPLQSTYWSYNKSKNLLNCKASSSNMLVTAMYDHPIRLELAEDGRFKESSGIFMIDRPDLLIDYLDLHILTAIKDFSERIPVQGFSFSIECNDTISRLTERISAAKDANGISMVKMTKSRY